MRRYSDTTAGLLGKIRKNRCRSFSILQQTSVTGCPTFTCGHVRFVVEDGNRAIIAAATRRPRGCLVHLASEQTVEPGVVRRHATCRVAQAQASVPHTLALTPLAPCTCRLMGLGVLLGLTGSVLINVGNNVQALGTELL